MPIRTTYTHARANLAGLWDEVTQNRKVVIVERRGAEAIAMIAADELSGLMETVHLLRSPRNAERLLTALVRARRGEGTLQTVEELARAAQISASQTEDILRQRAARASREAFERAMAKVADVEPEPEDAP